MSHVQFHEHETITGILGDDHDQLDGLLDDAFDLVSTDLATAQQRFAAFSVGLRRHIEIEDTVLFPAFEARTGMRDVGPTAVMRREHREIEHRLVHIAGALAAAAPSASEVQSELAALRALLADHNHREEAVLYPACDRMLGSQEVRTIWSALHQR